MLYLHRKKIITSFHTILLVGFFIFFSQQVQAQKRNLEDHDAKPYYFGITLGAHLNRFHTELHPLFLQQDTVLVAEPANASGLALGLSATGRISQRFELRFNPQLMFTERNMFYHLRYRDIDFGDSVTKKVDGVVVTFPLQLKFRSDRIGNFRVYMLGGGKVDFDLASNARARKAEDLLKINKLDYGVEGGLGFNFYFPSFILSPEIKISNGLGNLHSRDEKLKYSNVLDRIQSRMIIFSIHLEG